MSISKEAGALPIESMRKTEEEGVGARLGTTQMNVECHRSRPSRGALRHVSSQRSHFSTSHIAL